MFNNPYVPFSPSSPEDRLILTFAKSWATPREIESALNSNLNWDYIRKISTRNRVDFLLYYNLMKVNSDLIPTQIMKSLQFECMDTSGKNFLAYHQIKKVLKLFSQEEIKVIILKGLELYKTVYQNMISRPFTDVDLLIRKEDLHKAMSILSHLGYELIYDLREGFNQEFGFALYYVKDHSISIDLHQHISLYRYSKEIDIENLWNSAISIKIDETDALALSPENLLIHLCIHAIKHCCFKLYLLVDISETIHFYRERTDWDLLMENVEKYRLYPIISYIVKLLDKFFAPPIPDFVLQELKNYKPSKLRDKYYQVLTDPKIPGFKWALASFIAIDGIKSKMKFIYGKLLPSKRFIQVNEIDKPLKIRRYLLRGWNAIRMSAKVLMLVLKELFD